MIGIREDRGYLSELDIKAMKNHFAKLGVHSLRIVQHLTESQKEENLKASHTLSKEQWNQRCDENKKNTAMKIENIVDRIGEDFMIYQYKDKSNRYYENWDLFFWCNFGDMSYVTLSPNKKRSYEEQMKTIENALEFIKSVDEDGIEVIIQYVAIYDEDKVHREVYEYCENNQDAFIQYGEQIGKIVKYNEEFYFKKKNSKKYGYRINNQIILDKILEC